jgi:tetratricopeptide (TPR) repeat protein
LDGSTFICGWTEPTGVGNEPPQPDPFANLRLDFDKLAFGPEAQPAPPFRPEREPRPREWWSAYLTPPEPRPLDGDYAFLNWLIFEPRARLWQLKQIQAWQLALVRGVPAGLPALPALGGAPGLLGALGGWSLLHPDPDRERAQRKAQVVQNLADQFMTRQDGGHSAHLYLAIRAARRSLPVSPDDARTWLVLGMAYFHLSHLTREQPFGSPLPHLKFLRQVQTATALTRALELNPDYFRDAPGMGELAHRTLTGLYQEMGYLDLPAKHSREMLRYAQAFGPRPGETAEDASKRLGEMEKQVKALEGEVKDKQNDFELESANKPLLQRVQIALSKKLAETALAELRRADPAGQPREQAATIAMHQVVLLLRMGKLDEVRDGLPELKGLLGVLPELQVPAYEWFQIALAAASGDYEEADRYLKPVQESMAHSPGLYQRLQQLGVVGRPPGAVPDLNVSEAVPMMIGQLLLREAPTNLGIPVHVIPGFILPDGPVLFNQATQLAQLIGLEADLQTLRGMLALESGAIAAAREDFRGALQRTGWDEDRGWRIDFRARSLAQMGMEWVK